MNVIVNSEMVFEKSEKSEKLRNGELNLVTPNIVSAINKPKRHVNSWSGQITQCLHRVSKTCMEMLELSILSTSRELLHLPVIRGSKSRSMGTHYSIGLSPHHRLNTMLRIEMTKKLYSIPLQRTSYDNTDIIHDIHSSKTDISIGN